MYKSHTLLFCLASFCLAFGLLAQAKLPPSFSVKSLGFTKQASKSFKYVTRDGGGGGFVNGQHLITFSDTSTTKDKQLVGFTSNSVAFSNGKKPTKLTDFGDDGIPNLGIPWLSNETALAAKLETQDERLIIWPSSSIATLHDGKSGVSVYVVINLKPDLSGTVLYSTMVQYKPTKKGPGATRLAHTLFYPGEVHYGTFCTVTAPANDYILMFATVSGAQGIMEARAPISSPADRSRYEYWTGTAWSRKAPSVNDTKSYIVTDSGLFSTGDFIFSKHLKTWIFIYFDDQLTSQFYLRYSHSGYAHGPYSDRVVLYKTTPVKGDFNYAGHAYGGYDKSGKSVLLSWTYDGAQTEMATVKFH